MLQTDNIEVEHESKHPKHAQKQPENRNSRPSANGTLRQLRHSNKKRHPPPRRHHNRAILHSSWRRRRRSLHDVAGYGFRLCA